MNKRSKKELFKKVAKIIKGESEDLPTYSFQDYQEDDTPKVKRVAQKPISPTEEVNLRFLQRNKCLKQRFGGRSRDYWYDWMGNFLANGIATAAKNLKKKLKDPAYVAEMESQKKLLQKYK